MHVARDYLAATFLGLAAILTLGCGDSSAPAAPTTGALEITVSTEGPDVDPDGYVLSIDDKLGQAVDVNATVTISALSSGKHLVWLEGLAPNCSVHGTNPRLVEVVNYKAFSPVSFSVGCVTKIETEPSPWDY